jgi:hypothetical protein
MIIKRSKEMALDLQILIRLLVSKINLINSRKPVLYPTGQGGTDEAFAGVTFRRPYLLPAGDDGECANCIFNHSYRPSC